MEILHVYCQIMPGHHQFQLMCKWFGCLSWMKRRNNSEILTWSWSLDRYNIAVFFRSFSFNEMCGWIQVKKVCVLSHYIFVTCCSNEDVPFHYRNDVLTNEPLFDYCYCCCISIIFVFTFYLFLLLLLLPFISFLS